MIIDDYPTTQAGYFNCVEEFLSKTSYLILMKYFSQNTKIICVCDL